MKLCIWCRRIWDAVHEAHFGNGVEEAWRNSRRINTQVKAEQDGEAVLRAPTQVRITDAAEIKHLDKWKETGNFRVKTATVSTFHIISDSLY